MKTQNTTLHFFWRSLGRAKYLTRQRIQDTLFHLGRGKLRKPLIIVVGSSYRVGSTWLFLLLRDVAHCRMGKDHAPDELLEFTTLRLTPAAYDYMRELRGQFIFKSHSFPPDSAMPIGDTKFVSIYRDPRDVLVSASFFLAHLPEERGGMGESFRRLSSTERIRSLISGRSGLPILPKLEMWFRTPLAQKTSYENLTSHPVQELRKIAEFCGISTSSSALEKLSAKHAFEAKHNRSLEADRRKHHMRKGVVGDWRNHFDESCIDDFKEKRDGRWNRLLVEMGYEESIDWQK